MARVRVSNFSISLDGYGAGPDQDADHPLGRGGERLHEWIFLTRSGRSMRGLPGGEGGIDDQQFARRYQGVAATIMGRNMFGPVRGPWDDSRWAGWWGSDPPFHHPVFVLTHHHRPPIELEGGTTFHFVDAGIEAALALAREAARGADVAVGGGVATLRQFLRAGLIDDLHLVLVPLLLGGGERLFEDVEVGPDAYECVERISSPSVIHVRLTRSTSTSP
jgi:dihydrofolate reductase